MVEVFFIHTLFSARSVSKKAFVSKEFLQEDESNNSMETAVVRLIEDTYTL